MIPRCRADTRNHHLNAPPPKGNSKSRLHLSMADTIIQESRHQAGASRARAVLAFLALGQTVLSEPLD